jgi:hypothetical protein
MKKYRILEIHRYPEVYFLPQTKGWLWWRDIAWKLENLQEALYYIEFHKRQLKNKKTIIHRID